jgi:peroxiredoxin
MFKQFLTAAAAVLAFAPFAPAMAEATPGKPAPAISATDVAGKPLKLDDFRGKYVVLEWFNPSCPFVVKHYGSNNMQGLQQRLTGDGVVWIAVNSTAADHLEFLPAAKAAEWMQQQKAAPTRVVLDPAGTIGRAYGARTTPQMVIIDPKGTVVYNGAIDSIRSANQADVPKATNFVTQAFAELKAGKPISQPTTQPYGCSVKYGAG